MPEDRRFCTVMLKSLECRSFKLSSSPKNRQEEEAIITRTMVARMQMEASPAPFRFMRKVMEETEIK